MVSNNIGAAKLERYACAGWTVKTEKELVSQLPSISAYISAYIHHMLTVISAMSTWKPVTSAVP